MQEMTLGTMIAVLEEIFGAGLFRSMMAAAAVITAAYLYVLVRDRAISMRKFLFAQLAVLALLSFVPALTLWLPHAMGYAR